MPRGAKLTPEIDKLIAKVCLEHPEWVSKPQKIQQEVIRQLPDSLKVWGGPNWPGRDAIQFRLRKIIRPNLENILPESKRLDEPWSIGASVEHGIRPEATKDLFDIWRASLAMGRPISIRQAKWIVHIRNLFYQPISTGNPYSDKVNRNLWLIRQSWLYSILERVSEIVEEKHFDTTNLDGASFMSNWERATALKLGKISSVDYSQEALAKLEKHGTSLTSPPVSVQSVEEAVWHDVMAEPFSGEEIIAFFTDPDDILPEEDDLVAAYWLTYLSKGPLWNDLPLTPEAERRLERERQQREKGLFVPDSGESGSPWSRQLAVRRKLLDWVKAHHSMSIRDYHTLGRTPHASLVLSPKLLSMVGYEVSPEEVESYAKLHEEELKAGHRGWSRTSAEVKQRFILDEQTDDDLELLNKADNQVALELKQREIEFLELVRQKGGPPDNKAGYKAIVTFWLSIRDEWIKKYPEYKKKSPYGYLQWEEVETEYERLKASLEKEATNERSHTSKGQG